MKLQEIERRNSDIALMLGYVNTTPTDKDFNIFEYPTKIGIPNIIETMSMRFHSDWNWLHEAAEKVYSLTHPSDSIRHDIIQLLGRNQKEAVFIAVTDFAKLYNEKTAKFQRKVNNIQNGANQSISNQPSGKKDNY